jgi:hypothetical protein
MGCKLYTYEWADGCYINFIFNFIFAKLYLNVLKQRVYISVLSLFIFVQSLLLLCHEPYRYLLYITIYVRIILFSHRKCLECFFITICVHLTKKSFFFYFECSLTENYNKNDSLMWCLISEHKLQVKNNFEQ